MCIIIVGTHTCKHHTLFKDKSNNSVIYEPSKAVIPFEDGTIDFDRRIIAEEGSHHHQHGHGRNKSNHWDNPCDKPHVEFFPLPTECDTCKKQRKDWEMELEKQRKEIMRGIVEKAEKERVDREWKKMVIEKERQRQREYNERVKQHNRHHHQKEQQLPHLHHVDSLKVHARRAMKNNAREQNVKEIRHEIDNDKMRFDAGARQQGNRHNHHHSRLLADNEFLFTDMQNFANRGRSQRTGGR